MIPDRPPLREDRPASDNKLIARVIHDIRHAVAAKADELQTYGMLPGRIAFLRGLASIFGDELLDHLQLTWIPVTEPPGNVIHRSKADFVTQLKKTQRILLAVGVNPGAAYKVALPHISQQELGKMPVVAISREEIHVDYTEGEWLQRELSTTVITGSLHAAMSKASQDESKLVLTKFLLKCIAESWGILPETLCEQDWRLEFKDNVLWAELQRE